MATLDYCTFKPFSQRGLRPYSKSKIELKSNSSENFTSNCKFIRGSTYNLI